MTKENYPLTDEQINSVEEALRTLVLQLEEENELMGLGFCLNHTGAMDRLRTELYRAMVLTIAEGDN